MNVRLRRGEKASRGLARLFAAQTRAALQALGGARPPADARVHDARKRLKEARATLRLLRDSLTEVEYRSLNGALRDASRPFATVRDAKALIEILPKVANELGADAPPLRSRLTQERQRIRAKVLEKSPALRRARAKIRTARLRLARERPGIAGWKTIERGLRRTYRNGRDAMKAAEKSATDFRFHEWRKQAKYLRHELEILEVTHAKRVRALEKMAHKLTDLLGEDRDLAGLKARLGRAGSASAIRTKRAKLQKEAFRVGGTLFAKKPGGFTSSLRARWRDWRDG